MHFARWLVTSLKAIITVNRRRMPKRRSRAFAINNLSLEQRVPLTASAMGVAIAPAMVYQPPVTVDPGAQDSAASLTAEAGQTPPASVVPTVLLGGEPQGNAPPPESVSLPWRTDTLAGHQVMPDSITPAVQTHIPVVFCQPTPPCAPEAFTVIHLPLNAPAIPSRTGTRARRRQSKRDRRGRRA